MGMVLTIFAGLLSLYMILIFIRVLLTWFNGLPYSRPVELLCNLTDPYINWFRRFPLRVANLDLSPILALGLLQVLYTIVSTLARYGRITVGFVLALLLQIVWSVCSFILSFSVVILLLRLVAYLSNQNIYNSFWRIIDLISQPIIYRVNRVFFPRRLVNYMTGILVSIGSLLALRIGLGLLVRLGSRFLMSLPL